MKWFNNPTTAEELKEQYRKLAMKYHPDMGGDVEKMKEINNEYDILFPRLKDIHRSAKGETYTAENPTAETPDEFKHIIDRLVRMDGINIELCGSWLWITGNTVAHKEELKAMGFKWAAQKKAWFFHHGEYRKRSRKTMSMNRIREMYGSEFLGADKENLLLA